MSDIESLRSNAYVGTADAVTFTDDAPREAEQASAGLALPMTLDLAAGAEAAGTLLTMAAEGVVMVGRLLVNPVFAVGAVLLTTSSAGDGPATPGGTDPEPPPPRLPIEIAPLLVANYALQQHRNERLRDFDSAGQPVRFVGFPGANGEQPAQKGFLPDGPGQGFLPTPVAWKGDPDAPVASSSNKPPDGSSGGVADAGLDEPAEALPAAGIDAHAQRTSDIEKLAVVGVEHKVFSDLETARDALRRHFVKPQGAADLARHFDRAGYDDWVQTELQEAEALRTVPQPVAALQFGHIGADRLSALRSAIQDAVAQGRLAPGGRPPPTWEIAQQMNQGIPETKRLMRALYDEGLLTLPRHSLPRSSNPLWQVARAPAPHASAKPSSADTPAEPRLVAQLYKQRIATTVSAPTTESLLEEYRAAQVRDGLSEEQLRSVAFHLRQGRSPFYALRAAMHLGHQEVADRLTITPNAVRVSETSPSPMPRTIARFVPIGLDLGMQETRLVEQLYALPRAR